MQTEILANLTAALASQAAASEALARAFLAMYPDVKIEGKQITVDTSKVDKPKTETKKPAAPKTEAKKADKPDTSKADAEAAELAKAEADAKKAAAAKAKAAAAKAKAAEAEKETATDGDSAPTERELRSALHWVMSSYCEDKAEGRETAKMILDEHANGIYKAPDVAEDHRAAVISACVELGYEAE